MQETLNVLNSRDSDAEVFGSSLHKLNSAKGIVIDDILARILKNIGEKKRGVLVL